MSSIRSQAIWIFIAGLLLFTIGLSSQEIISFESRFYLFALEMWRHGASWFPTTYQQPYPDYPVTATVMIYGASKLLGGLSKFTAILPSAMAAAFTLSVTYLIGALHSRKWGMAAVLTLLFTITFVGEARTISIDQYVTAITTLCFYLVYSGQYLEKSKRIYWIFPLMILGFAFRGPLGLVIPAGVICVFYLLEADFKRLVMVAIVSAILLGICCAALLMIANHAGGANLMHEVLEKQVLGRMQADAQTPPFYFYFVEPFGAYAVAYPLAFLVLLGLLPNFHFSQTTKLLKKIVGWALVILIGLSIPADKKMRYILPAAPAMALMCGYLFMVAQERKYFYTLKRLFVLFCGLFPIACLVTLVVLHHRHPDLVFFYRTAVSALCVLVVLMFVVQRRELLVFGVAVLAFMAVNILVIEPINISLNSTRSFVLQAENLRQASHAQLVFFHENTDGLVIKYLVNMPQETQPIFIDTPAQLSKIKKPTFIVVTQENYRLIPKKIAKKLKVIMYGRLGREPVILIKAH